MNFTERFQRNLRRVRKDKGLSQEDVAQAVGVTRTTYALWESGKFTPGPDKFDLLAKELGVDVGEFFTPEGHGEFERKLADVHEAFVTIVDYTRSKLLEDLQVAKKPEQAESFKDALIRKVAPPR
jgi:transcriptional regulator with XRE-family HTH domain